MNSPYRFHQSLRANLYSIIFGTQTKAGRNFDLSLLAFIIISVLLVMLETVESIGAYDSSLFNRLEWFFTLVFLTEYCIRIYCSPTPKRYIFSFYGFIDLVSILPAFLVFFFPSGGYFIFIRLIRLLRIFRVLKLFRFISEANVLMRALVQARRKIFVFFSTVLILAAVMGAMMFVVEGPDNGFSSIPQGIYWAIVTVTTVGYGDVVPHTALGKGLASFAMLLGYAIIAIPTGIIGSHLSYEMERERLRNECRSCKTQGHDHDAKHCKFCGSSLDLD